MNNDNREGQPVIHQVTPEELQQTQVLNIQEVEETVRIEKSLNKKPIIIVAIVGLAFLIFGSSFQVLSSLNAKEPKSNVVEKRKVVPEVKKEDLTCVKTTLNNPNGTDVVYNIKYEFTNDKLSSYTKTYTVTQIADNETGKQTIIDEANKYQQFLNSTEGYIVSLTTSENGYVLMNQVDFDVLDLTKVNNKQNEDSFTTIEYNKNTEKETVRTAILKEGFTCN